MLAGVRATQGTAVMATDDEMLAAGKELASAEGIFAAPEGAATVVAARKLAEEGWIKPHERVVLLIPGADINIARLGRRRCKGSDE